MSYFHEQKERFASNKDTMSQSPEPIRNKAAIFKRIFFIQQYNYIKS